LDALFYVEEFTKGEDSLSRSILDQRKKRFNTEIAELRHREHREEGARRQRQVCAGRRMCSGRKPMPTMRAGMRRR